MDFKTYLDSSWSKHGKDSQKVAETFEATINLITDSSQLTQLAHLITHVEAEHLGQYSRGLKLIKLLSAHKLNNDKTKVALNRFEAILQFAENSNFDITPFSDSDQIRILAAVASAQAGQSQTDLSTKNLNQALALAEKLDSADPANRALAVTGNILASTLEDKSDLSPEQIDLMLLAARAGRKYWEISGTWLETERAEYRLAHSYLKAKDYINSIKHANLCLTICEKNSAPPLEFFFAFEAIALVEKAMAQLPRSFPKMESYFSQLSESDKSWCGPTLKKFN